MSQRYIGFGLQWHSDLPLSRYTPAPAAGDAQIQVLQVETPTPRELLRLHPGAHVQQGTDGFRYHAAQEAVIDYFRGEDSRPDRLEITPGPDWTGGPPVGFFGTVAALLLAWRGAIPLHGSAIEFNGRAVLICGASGAGKSTLAAGLIALGGRLISDDLSVLHLQPRTGQYVFYAGRRTIRLFDATAGYLQQAVPLSEPPCEAEGKIAVTPPHVAVGEAFPLHRLILLGHAEEPDPASTTAALLEEQLFRPRWMQRLPGRMLRQAALALAARQATVLRFSAAPVRDRESFLLRAKSASIKI